MSKLVAILGGGDWADASVDFLMLPDDINLDDAKQAWREWYRTYDPYAKPTYMPFVEFVKKRYSATEPDDTQLTVYWDD